jgi:hypothetical protein
LVELVDNVGSEGHSIEFPCGWGFDCHKIRPSATNPEPLEERNDQIMNLAVGQEIASGVASVVEFAREHCMVIELLLCVIS